jgi:hypothetical protein
VVVVVVLGELRVVYHGENVDAIVTTFALKVNVIGSMAREKSLDVLFHPEKSCGFLHALAVGGLQKALVIVLATPDVTPSRGIGVFVLLAEEKTQFVVANSCR